MSETTYEIIEIDMEGRETVEETGLTLALAAAIRGGLVATAEDLGEPVEYVLRMELS